MLLHELALVLRKRVQQLHAADVSRLLWAYATAGVSDARMLSAVTGATCEEVHSVLPRTAAGAVWALGRLQHQAPAFMEAALDRLAACMEASLPLPERAPPAAGAGAGVQPPSMLQQLYQQPPAAWLDVPPANDAAEDAAVAAASSRLQQQMGQQLSDVELALLASSDADERGRALRAGSDHSTSAPAEQASWLHKQLFPGFEVSSSSTEAGTEQPLQQQQALQALQAQQQQGRSLVVTHSDIAQAAWAAGRLRHYSMAFFVALRPRFVCLLPGFTDSQLVQVLWGLARLNLHHAPNMDAAAQELARRAPRLSGPLVALSAWAFASLRHRHEGVLAALTARAAALAGTDHGQPLPQPYWQQPLEPLGPLEPLELQQQQQQQQQPSRLCLRPLDARQLVYAAARLSYNNPLLLRTCAQVRVCALSVMRPGTQHMPQITHALGVTPSHTQQVLKRHLSNLDMAVAVTGLWGFAVAGHYDEALTAGLLRVAGGRPVAAYGTLSLLQLFQAVTLLQVRRAAGQQRRWRRRAPCMAFLVRMRASQRLRTKHCALVPCAARVVACWHGAAVRRTRRALRCRSRHSQATPATAALGGGAAAAALAAACSCSSCRLRWPASRATSGSRRRCAHAGCATRALAAAAVPDVARAPATPPAPAPPAAPAAPAAAATAAAAARAAC
jgi:hypothetical protein